jgi:hypothetical protein
VIEVCSIYLFEGFDIINGQLFDESIIEVFNGKLIRLPELGSRLTVGEKGNVSLTTST